MSGLDRKDRRMLRKLLRSIDYEIDYIHYSIARAGFTPDALEMLKCADRRRIEIKNLLAGGRHGK